MSVAYHSAQKVRYRVTLELETLPDFDPHQIDWEKLFKLEPAEKCEAYVEDLSTPDRWGLRSLQYNSLRHVCMVLQQHFKVPQV